MSRQLASSRYYLIASVFMYTVFVVLMLKYVFNSQDNTPSLSVTTSASSLYTNMESVEYEGELERIKMYTKMRPKYKNITTPTNSVILVLAQNKDFDALRSTLREFEDRFNRKFHYPYVVLNDKPFTEEFKYYLQNMVSSKIEFGLIKKEHWSIPDSMDKQKTKKAMEEQGKNGILYGEKESYHHMCRYFSGFFMNHELLQKYDYYWRVEPNVHFFCDIDFDPFLFMQTNNKVYSFTIALKELENTIPSLWRETINFAKDNKLKTNLLRYFTNMKTDGYNLCHFWSNFEIASLNFFRSEQYQNYFKALDKTGNFFYERWGDAPVHSLALGLFLNYSQVHFFHNIGYQHDDLFHCPDLSNEIYRKRCLCPKGKNFDDTYFSCLPSWKKYKDQIWDFS